VHSTPHWQTPYATQRHMNTRRKRWTDMGCLNQMNFAYSFRAHRGALRRTIGIEMIITYWGAMFKQQTLGHQAVLLTTILTLKSLDKRLRSAVNYAGSASGIDVICNVFQSSLYQLRYLERGSGTNHSRMSLFHPARNSLRSNNETPFCAGYAGPTVT
jgi:hypothetical protein